jgi:hypothetical protein
MEARSGIGTQAHDVPGVGWNLRLIEHDMKHGLALRMVV